MVSSLPETLVKTLDKNLGLRGFVFEISSGKLTQNSSKNKLKTYFCFFIFIVSSLFLRKLPEAPAEKQKLQINQSGWEEEIWPVK